MKCGNETEPATHKTELTFGLNSTKCPLQVKKLVPFEDDLMKDMRSSNKISTAADKSQMCIA